MPFTVHVDQKPSDDERRWVLLNLLETIEKEKEKGA